MFGEIEEYFDPQLVMVENVKPETKKRKARTQNHQKKKITRRPRVNLTKRKILPPIIQEEFDMMGEPMSIFNEFSLESLERFMPTPQADDNGLACSDSAVFDDLDLKRRLHQLSDQFQFASTTKKMVIYVQAKILLAGGYVSQVKEKKPKGTKTKGQDNQNLFLSMAQLAPIVLKIMKKREMGWFEEVLWALLAQPQVQKKIVSGIRPASFIERMKRRCYDVFSVFEGAQIIQGIQSEPRFWAIK